MTVHLLFDGERSPPQEMEGATLRTYGHRYSIDVGLPLHAAPSAGHLGSHLLRFEDPPRRWERDEAD